MIDQPASITATDAAAKTPTKPSPSDVKWVWLSALAYFVFNTLLPVIQLPRISHLVLALLTLFTTLVFMGLQIGLQWRIARLQPKPLNGLLYALALVAAWFFVFRYIHPYRSLAALPNVLMLLLHRSLNSFILTFALSFLGSSLSIIVREAKILLPVGIIAMIIDTIGAMTPIGFTQNVVANHPNVVRAVSVSLPTVGHLAPISTFGPGDILFLGFFFSVVIRLGLNARGTIAGMYGLLTVAMLAVITFGINIGALVPMGIAAIAANFKEFKFSREETFAMVYSGVLVVGLTMAFFVYAHHQAMRHH